MCKSIYFYLSSLLLIVICRAAQKEPAPEDLFLPIKWMPKVGANEGTEAQKLYIAQSGISPYALMAYMDSEVVKEFGILREELEGKKEEINKVLEEEGCEITYNDEPVWECFYALSKNSNTCKKRDVSMCNEAYAVTSQKLDEILKAPPAIDHQDPLQWWFHASHWVYWNYKSKNNEYDNYFESSNHNVRVDLSYITHAYLKGRMRHYFSIENKEAKGDQKQKREILPVKFVSYKDIPEGEVVLFNPGNKKIKKGNKPYLYDEEDKEFVYIKCPANSNRSATADQQNVSSSSSTSQKDTNLPNGKIDSSPISKDPNLGVSQDVDQKDQTSENLSSKGKDANNSNWIVITGICVVFVVFLGYIFTDNKPTKKRGKKSMRNKGWVKF